MSTTKKVLTIIACIVFAGILIGVSIWGFINWSKVKEGFKGSGLYTQQDIQKSYEDGFNKALSDKNEYEKLINSYKDTITTQNDLISKHTSEVAILNNTIKEYSDQLVLLTEQRDNLEIQISALNDIKKDNEKTISELNKQIESLSNQVTILQTNEVENAKQIEILTTQITSLQSINSQLQSTNELNTQTINNLNVQNTALNNQIAELTSQIQNNSSIVGTLNAKITELEKSVQYYEQYLASITQGELLMVTFEFDGSVYNVQMVNKDAIISVSTPQSTEYVIFNGWTVNGEIVDLSTYVITENTRFIADVIYKYDIKFLADGENVRSEIMLKDSKITPPEAPFKSGYVFEGWTANGFDLVNFDNYKVSQHTTFTAKYSKQYTVLFEFDGATIASQTVLGGHYAEPPNPTSTFYKVFNGWKLNGVKVDVLNYKITSDTVFVADITYKYDVRFMVDNEIYNSQIIEKNTTATTPTAPVKGGYVFLGWSINGTDIVDVESYNITDTTEFVAVFKADKFTVTFKDGDRVIKTEQVTNGGLTSAPDFDSDTFLGWTVNGTDIVDFTTFKITAETTFTAKYGTWQLLTDEQLYVYGEGQNQETLSVNGLKAGDKIKVTANHIKTNISMESDAYMINSPDGNGCYGWAYGGNGMWCQLDQYGNVIDGSGFADAIELNSMNDFTSIMGYSDYGVENEFTISISCKKDGILTIEWTDQAGGYIDIMTMWGLYVLR